MTVVTRAATVVPSIVEAGSVVPGTLVPFKVVAATVSAGIMLSGLVVPGIVTVYVAGAPRMLAGMALPTPLLVQGVGKSIVAVLGLAPRFAE